MKSYLMACYKFSADLHESALVDEVQIGLSTKHFQTVYQEACALKKETTLGEVKEFKFNVPGGVLVIFNKDLK